MTDVIEICIVSLLPWG